MPLIPQRLRQSRAWIIALPVLVLLVTVAGPFVYINFLRDDPPACLTLSDAATSTSATAAGPDTTAATSVGRADAPDGIEGTWTVTTDGTQAGYRVKEVLFGQDAEAVGRTSDVNGTLVVIGTTLTATDVEVDMTTVASSESRRDGQFRGRIMSTDQYPTATFSLTEPIALGWVPPEGEELELKATGRLTLRGVTQDVTFDLKALRTGATIVINATIPVDFDDYHIPDASGGPASVGRSGEIELLVVFSR